MKVLVPFGHNEWGGSQLAWLRLVDALQGREYSFVCWVFESGPLTGACERRGIPCSMVPCSWTRTPWGLVRLALLMREEAPDVIYLHASRAIALIARCLRVPCIERINMSRVPEAGGWSRHRFIDRFFCNLNTRLLAVSGATRHELLNRGVCEDKVVVIRNFVDFEHYHRPELRLPTRRELGISRDAVVVLNVGRMVPQKAQADFLKIAARCLPEDRRLFFLLLGDGPLRRNLEREAQKLGLPATGRFLSLPFQRQIERIYAASDILLHTAHWEPLANVLLEAMAADLAVVATDVGGTREAISGYSKAMTFSPGDIDTAVSAICRIVSSPESGTASSGGRHVHSGHGDWRARFSRDLHVQAFSQLLDAVCSASGGK